MICSLHRFFYVFVFASALSSTVRAQNWQGAIALPTSADGSSQINSLVADGSGGYLLAGQFSGTLTLGSFVLTSAGGQDAFVARLTAAGTYTQALRAGGSGDDIAVKLAVDANGLATVAGTFASSTLVLGTATLTNTDPSPTPSSDVFVARLSAAGAWVQAAQGGGPTDDTVIGVALDPNGSAVIAGAYLGATAKFGTLTLSGSVMGGTPFVARLGSSGTWSQAVRVGSNSTPLYISNVAVTTSGSAVVTGLCLGGGTVTLGSYTLDTRGLGNCLFVARLNRVGSWVQAVQTTGLTGTTIARHLAIDAADNVVVAGETTSAAAAFGSYTVASTVNADGTHNFVSFIARLSAAGTWTQVAQTTGSLGSCYTSAVALDASGNAWLTGHFNSSAVNFGSLTLTNSDPNSVLNNHFDLYLARLSNTGTWTFVTTATNATAHALVLSNSLATVAGNFIPPATFGTTALTSPAPRAGFLANLAGNMLAAQAPESAVSFGVWPNPATGTTTLGFTAADTPRVVQLLDALGREVRHYVLPPHTTSLTLDLTALPHTMYLLRCGSSTSRLALE